MHNPKIADMRRRADDMRIAVISALIALASSAAVADVKRHQFVPEALRGSWAQTLDLCKGSEHWVISVSAKAYVSPDADCAVAWVSETPSARGPVYSAHLQCSKLDGKTQQAQSNVVFMLGDANQLSIGPTFSQLKAYKRCSGDPPASAR